MKARYGLPLSMAILFVVMISGWSWMLKNCHPPADSIALDAGRP